MGTIEFLHSLRPRFVSSVAAAPRPANVSPLLAVLGASVCVGAVVVSAAGSESDAVFGRGLVELLIVGTPMAAGLYALRSPVNAGLGIALLAIGLLWSLTALAETSFSVPYTIGRTATWLLFPGVVYLLLAFPDGRISKGIDTVIFIGLIAVFVVLFYATVPLVQAFPPKTLWSTCTTDCPPNAFFVLDRQPTFLADLIFVREWLVELLWLGLFWSMLRRWRAASPLQRRAMGPVFVAGGLLGLCHIAHITYRQLDGPTDTVVAISSAWTVCIVAVCAAILVGLVRRRTFLADALARLGSALRAGASPEQVRDALATAVGDSSIEPLFRDADTGAWRDARGRSVAWPEPLAAGRAATAIGDEVVLIHDVALRDDQELLDGVSTMMLVAWRHEQIKADLAQAMSHVEDSRRRIAEAADLERARIERDLHDGAQQRLIALRIRLGLAEEQLRDDPAAGIRAIGELGFQAEFALEELRTLAQGVYPSLLADRGLPDALKSVALQAPIPINVVTDGVTRHPMQIETAVYFTCVEAVQNAMKHAATATAVWITLEQSPGTLRFEVRDDGRGFTPTNDPGRGLRNMHDRIEAVGGELIVETAPGRGTRVAGFVEVR